MKKNLPALKPESFYSQNLKGLFDYDLLDQKAFEKNQKLCQQAVHKLKEAGIRGQLEMLESVFWKDDIPTFNAIGTSYRRFHSVLVVGMGGSGLGGKTLCSLFQSWIMSDSSFPFMYFLDNLDSEIFWELMSVLNPKTTGVLIISKSGETPETLAILMRLLEYWKDYLTPQELSTHFTAITSEKSTLAKMADHFHITRLPHPPAIGGRFSCFSITALLPLVIVGGDPRKVRRGGASVIHNFFAQSTSPPLDGAAALYTLYETKRITSHVFFAYGDAFQLLTQWCRQLMAESLGKDGKGFTPLTALGPQDQHSQLQLYLGGPKDKFFSLFSEKKRPREKLRPELWNNFPEIRFLSHTTLDDLLVAQERATANVMLGQGCFVREFHMHTLNELSMGAIFAHMMLETLLLAELMGVNPLDQPTVDNVKVLSKRFLENLTGD